MKNNAGVLPGIFSCIFGVTGILSLGFIFVPLAAITALFSTVLSVINLSFRGMGVSLLAWLLAVIGLFTSPALLAAIGIALSVPENTKQTTTIITVEANNQKIANDSLTKSSNESNSKEQQKISIMYANNNPIDEVLSVSGLSKKYSECGDYQFSGVVINIEPFEESILVTLENNLGFRELIQIHNESIKQTQGSIKKLLSPGANLSTTGQICGSGGYYYVGSITKDIKSRYSKPDINYRTIENLIFDANNATGKNILLNGKFTNISLSNGAPTLEIRPETDTNLKFWKIFFSEDFTSWAKSLKKEQEISIVCQVVSIRGPITECNLLRMHFD